MSGESKLTVVCIAKYLEAHILKGRLENEGIPAMLQYESTGVIFGLTADGLGEAKILVPEDLAEAAMQILQDEMEEEPES